jgi:asparagine synthase (glutamine-hydrolysing)
LHKFGSASPAAVRVHGAAKTGPGIADTIESDASCGPLREPSRESLRARCDPDLIRRSRKPACRAAVRERPMCGIAGFNWEDERLIRAMTDALRHRGPDDEGTYVDSNVSLGHRRLAIIDLSQLGHQPMAYERDGRRVIVTYNGEIFNFREVRDELAARGYRFRSESDTEVILASYLEWGADCVHRFNGMWAFGLYEPAARRLLLSRDRFGEKPLHYRIADGRLIFASEIKAIFAHPLPRRANPRIVADYLYRAEANGSLESFFEGILMLPPAHNALFDLEHGRLALHRYYEPRRGSRRVPPEEFRAVLRRSVERRLVSDVPISISLSSGTDSTSVAALTAQLANAKVRAFTTAADGGVGNETALLAHFLARYPQFELASSNLSEESFCRHYREIIYHMDEPFARQSAYVRWEIAHLARGHEFKVLLNGEGADEVLGGYAAFAPRFLLDLLRRLRLIRFCRELVASAVHPERTRLLQEVRAMRAASPSRKGEQAANAAAFQRKYQIAIGPTRARSAPRGDIKDFLGDWVHASSLPRLLVCNDKMSMANSVEGRAPFLDHEFVDMAFSMTTDDLVVNGLRKYPLRDAMRGLLPREILFRRSKDAFNAPIFEYLRSEPLQSRVREVFRDPRTAAVFSPRAYLDEYERFLARRGADRPFLLHGLFLEEWARMFEVDFVGD